MTDDAHSDSSPSIDGRDSARRRHFRALADVAPAMLWVTDTEDRCVYLSHAWREFTGQAETEGLGFGWLEAVHPDDRQGAADRFLEASRRREPFALDHRVRRADGAWRWVIDAGRPRFEEDGTWSGYVGSVIDVHDRQVATAALARSEERYRALFNSIDAGFCVLEMVFEEGRPVDYWFVETNPAFLRQTGLEDPVGKRARELVPGLEQHWVETYAKVAVTREPARFENGSEAMGRWFDVYAFPTEAPERHRVALLFTDITAQRSAALERDRLLQAAEAARVEAEVANRAKSEFLASMSHELRTPLNAIGGYVQLLDMAVYGDVSEDQRDALARIAANQRHLLMLINDVLSFAQLEGGHMAMDVGPLVLTELLQSMDALVAPQAAARRMTYSLHPCGEGLCVAADAERVRQILLNLLGNAFKFSAEGGTVTVDCDADEERVRIRVRDDGPGVPAEDLERIFDPFHQVGRRLNRPQDGVGLGLAISRDLARAMGGDVTVCSRIDEGSTFTLELPLAREGPAP